MIRGRGELPRGRLANAALAVGTTLLALLLLAVVWEVRGNVRYYRWRTQFTDAGWLDRLTVASPDAALIWEYRPNAEAFGIATNRWGFRQVDYPTPQKPPGVRRVAFIGDSVTLGMGVAPADTFVQHVADLAAAAGQPLQALNFGVDGYHALQVRELMAAKVPPFQPDEVVYAMCLNDFDFTDSSGRKIAFFRKPGLFLPEDLRRAWRAVAGIEFHRDHFRRHRDEVFAAVADMKRMADTRHERFLVAIVPVFPERKGAADWFGQYPLRDLHQEVVRFCTGSGIRVHDLGVDFRRQPPPADRYCLDLWHLSAEGHRVVAESLWRDIALGNAGMGR